MFSLSPRKMALYAAAGSTGLLAGAYVFQALGYAPCQMCFWQRYPHALAALIGLVLIAIPSRILIATGALATFVTSALGLFHAGVEQKWWDGPASCSGNGNGLLGLSGNDLLATNVLDKVVMCDEISWAFIGLSMPAWNALLSAFLCGIWLIALRRS
tara:strand:+ start:596 stop:1066 length:471 start_codon:yes stop_codon:yes gene_type:complete